LREVAADDGGVVGALGNGGVCEVVIHHLTPLHHQQGQVALLETTQGMVRMKCHTTECSNAP